MRRWAARRRPWGLPAGEAQVALEDLSGAFARCDALLFTQDASYVPPNDAAREVRLTFDPDLNPLHPRGNPLPPTLVKAYEVEVFDGRDWVSMATETRNTVRHRIHKFQSRTVTAVRVRIDETWGDPSARVFEVRCY